MIGELPEFDTPLFKLLANNDTGASSGHQGGVVIPKDLSDFFPDLSGSVSAASPTVDETIRAALFVGDTLTGVVQTRYQHQTWGGVRTPERRITGNLGSLRNAATGGDYLIIERGATDPSFYRLRLIKKGSSDFLKVQSAAAGRRWGPLDIAVPPVTETEVVFAKTEQDAHESAPLVLFDNAAALVESRNLRIARSRAFQAQVNSIYQKRCAVCVGGLVCPTGRTEVEAAHIVPRSLKGADDARNGLCLCRSHHWAFDRGLFGIDTHGDIVVPSNVVAISANSDLAGYSLKRLGLPTILALAPAEEALAWHFENVMSVHL